MTVKGIDNVLTRLSRCCSPLPGDPIIGYVTRGKGVAVHRKDCHNIRTIVESAENSPQDAERASRLIDVYWTDDSTRNNYQVELEFWLAIARGFWPRSRTLFRMRKFPFSPARFSQQKTSAPACAWLLKFPTKSSTIVLSHKSKIFAASSTLSVTTRLQGQ